MGEMSFQILGYICIPPLNCGPFTKLLVVMVCLRGASWGIHLRKGSQSLLILLFLTAPNQSNSYNGSVRCTGVLVLILIQQMVLDGHMEGNVFLRPPRTDWLSQIQNVLLYLFILCHFIYWKGVHHLGFILYSDNLQRKCNTRF